MNNKEIAIDRVLRNLKGQADFIKESQTLSQQDKIEQLEVIYELVVHIEDYKKRLNKLQNFER